MRLVHVSCLNEWRMQSANPHSYFRCDQCQYIYLTERTAHAPWLESKAIHRAISAAVLAAVLLLSALLCGLLPTNPVVFFYRLVKWDPLWRGNPALVLYIAGDALDRLMAGLLVVAAIGCALSVRDAIHAHAGGQMTSWLCALFASFAASGVRILRVFAVFGVLTSVRVLALYIEGRSRVYLVRWGERVLDRREVTGA
ncbi:hypothetical protein T492DRAFT_606643 [Pavlovales sp. CCMP2436]|nr:hypothetical protein T492DRAFT_606643 [Pavlovales sp. CCMP2436]